MINQDIIHKLTSYIIFQMEDRDCSLFRTRLIKFLYLIDYEFYRVHRRPLTGVPWIRYQFGPYSAELLESINGNGIAIGNEELDYSSGKGISIEGRFDDYNFEILLPNEIRRIADNIISRWCDEELNSLLDYVYCETEPMENSEFGQPLLFTSVRKEPRYAGTHLLSFTDDETIGIKAIIDKTPLLGQSVAIEKNDEIIARVMTNFENEEKLDSLQGKAKLDVMTNFIESGE